MKFKIAIGKEKGDKQFEDDNKTPEGIYFVNRIIDGKSLPENMDLSHFLSISLTTTTKI